MLWYSIGALGLYTEGQSGMYTYRACLAYRLTAEYKDAHTFISGSPTVKSLKLVNTEERAERWDVKCLNRDRFYLVAIFCTHTSIKLPSWNQDGRLVNKGHRQVFWRAVSLPTRKEYIWLSSRVHHHKNTLFIHHYLDHLKTFFKSWWQNTVYIIVITPYIIHIFIVSKTDSNKFNKVCGKKSTS